MDGYNFTVSININWQIQMVVGETLGEGRSRWWGENPEGIGWSGGGGEGLWIALPPLLL